MANGGSDGSCHYSVLGLRKEASLSDIRKAYRKLALRWHPDRMTKNPSVTAGDANRRFQRIQEAYSVLSDEGKRSMYDAGTLDLFDEDDDEGMGEFMHDLFKMMDKNNNNRAGAGAGGEVGRKEESLEDLQRSFMETFGADLAAYLNNTTAQDDQHSYHPYPHPKTTTTTTRSHHTTPYARAIPKTRPATTTNSSTSTTS